MMNLRSGDRQPSPAQANSSPRAALSPRHLACYRLSVPKESARNGLAAEAR
jgi:hypothetical protein